MAMVYFYFEPKIEIFKIRFGGRWAEFLTDAAMVLAFVALIGIFWEFFEFISDFFFKSDKLGLFQAGAADTLSDLFFDLVGGVTLFAVYKYLELRN